MSMINKGPSIMVANNDNDAINIVNGLSGNNYTTIEDALGWVSSQDDVYVQNKTMENIVTDGLVLYLDASNVESYPKGGTTWYDLSGNENNGTLINGVSYNGDMVFDGTNQFVSFPNPLNQSNLLQVWTVMAWINITDKVVQYLVSGLNQGCYVCYAQGNNSLLYLNGGANDYYTYGGDLGNIGWVLATFRFDNSDGARTIYRNLTDISTSGPNKTSIPSGQSSTFYLGSGLDGNIAQLLIYNRYISNEELEQNYNEQKSRFGL